MKIFEHIQKVALPDWLPARLAAYTFLSLLLLLLMLLGAVAVAVAVAFAFAVAVAVTDIRLTSLIRPTTVSKHGRPFLIVELGNYSSKDCKKWFMNSFNSL